MKYLKIVLPIMLLITLSACSSEKDEKDASLVEVSMDTITTGLVDVVGDDTVLLEMNIHNEEAKENGLSVGHYINGESEDIPMEFSSSIEEPHIDKPIYLLVTHRIMDDQQQWKGAIILGEGSSSQTRSELTDVSGLFSSG